MRILLKGSVGATYEACFQGLPMRVPFKRVYMGYLRGSFI